MTIPYFLQVAYVGTDFFGWQIQTSLRSVQGELWRAVQAFEPGRATFAILERNIARNGLDGKILNVTFDNLFSFKTGKLQQPGIDLDNDIRLIGKQNTFIHSRENGIEFLNLVLKALLEIVVSGVLK